MWTLKRILIMLGGMTVFLTGYAVYAYFLGGFNGLQVLPDRYVPMAGSPAGPEKPLTEGERDAKFKRAFGLESEESKWAYKFDLGPKGVLFAATNFDLENGRIKLWPFSAALFSKNKSDGGFPEINTVRCDYAYLTPDRPVSNIAEVSKCKIIGVELQGPITGITLINNRRTPDKIDDIELFITKGSLFYLEEKNLIWTEGTVQLTDFKTRPETKITAYGMQLKLSEDSGLNRPRTAPKKTKEGSVSGVETLLLKNDVEMHFYIENSSGFLGGPAPVKAGPHPKDQADEKAHIAIKTPPAGSFFYDLNKEVARFDAPPPDAAGVAALDQVRVTREHKLGDITTYDVLLCDQLELHFRKKPDDGSKAARDPQAPDKEIDFALARTKHKELTLTMETENLEASGAELEYRSAAASLGPQTILRGSAAFPMEAVKDGHKIAARDELHLVGADKNGAGQQAMAAGPGQIDLYDKANPANPYPNHAKWRDSLITSKVREGDKIFDVWTLTGDASFIDDEHKQALHGQRLQVWLEADGRPGEPNRAATSTPAKQKLHKIEAFEKVSLHRPDFKIVLTNHLAILFKNEAAAGARLPNALPAAKTPPGAAPPVVLRPGAAKTPVPAIPQTIAVVSPTKNSRPIELWANDVVTYITTLGEAQELEQLVARGAVHVFQEGDEAKDRDPKAGGNGVDITGEMLHLNHHPRGDTLVIFGAGKQDAQLKLGELLIMGPKVTINQERNFAEVEGAGAMDMPSDTSFDGGQAKKTKTRLRIYWNKHMEFDGKDARFEGGVQAFQDGASLKGEYLQVVLNRVVSLKEGQKENQDAAVEKLVCDRSVWLEDEKKDSSGKRLQYDRLKAMQLAVDKLEERVIASGPAGIVWHLAEGGGNDPFAASRPKESGRKEEALKLTRVHYDGQMNSYKTGQARIAKFFDHVEVYHFPATSPDAGMNPDAPPKDGFYMRCNVLTVETRQLDGRSSQTMEAQNNVLFRTHDFYGTAVVVTFEESKDMVTFRGVPGNRATLYRQLPGQRERQEIRGTTIQYNRKTGEINSDGVTMIRGQ